jgi:RHS repeat-associated protein
MRARSTAIFRARAQQERTMDHREPSKTSGFIQTGWIWNLVHLRARNHDPAMRQMMSPDPLISDGLSLVGFNRFAFVYGDPINDVDPSGLTPNEADVTAAERALELARQRANHSARGAGGAGYIDDEGNHGVVVVVSEAQEEEAAASGAHGNARMSATKISATTPRTWQSTHRRRAQSFGGVDGHRQTRHGVTRGLETF